MRSPSFVVIPANLVPVLTSLLEDGFETALYGFVPGTLLTIAFAVLLGTWITRIITQSEERGQLIRELEESREENARLSREAGVAGERARLAAEIHDTLRNPATKAWSIASRAFGSSV